MTKTAADRVKQFPGTGLIVRKGELICTFCSESLKFERKSTIENHLKSKGHLDRKATGLAQLPADVAFVRNKERDTVWTKMAAVFVGAGVPLNVFSNANVREWLSSNLKNGNSLPSQSTLRRYLATEGLQDVSKTAEICGGARLILMIDETQDLLNRKLVNVLVKPAAETGYFRLAHTEVADKCDSETVVQIVLRSLTAIQADIRQVIALVSDNARYMLSAARILQGINSKVIHTTCWAHVIHLVAEEVRSTFKVADQFIGKVKSALIKAPSRRQELLDMLERHGKPRTLPPVPVITRWATWLKAGDYHFKHLAALKEWIDVSCANSKAMEGLKELVLNPHLHKELEDICLIYPSIEDAINFLENSSVPASEVLLKLETVKGVLELSPNLEAGLNKLENYINELHPAMEFWRNVEYFDPRKLSKFSNPRVFPECLSKIYDADIPIQELIAYQNISSNFTADRKFCVKSFWKNYSKEMPTLSEAALCLLSIPPTSAEVERSLSHLTRLLQPTRLRLTPENLAIHLRIQFNSRNQNVLLDADEEVDELEDDELID